MKIAVHRSVRGLSLDVNDSTRTLNNSKEANILHIITKKSLAKLDATLMLFIKSMGIIKEPSSRCRAGSYSDLRSGWREIWSGLRWLEIGVYTSLLGANSLIVVCLARCKGLGNTVVTWSLGTQCSQPSLKSVKHGPFR